MNGGLPVFFEYAMVSAGWVGRQKMRLSTVFLVLGIASFNVGVYAKQIVYACPSMQQKIRDGAWVISSTVNIGCKRATPKKPCKLYFLAKALTPTVRLYPLYKYSYYMVPPTAVAVFQGAYAVRHSDKLSCFYNNTSVPNSVTDAAWSIAIPITDLSRKLEAGSCKLGSAFNQKDKCNAAKAGSLASCSVTCNS
jgi:hypothetical protein